MTTSKAAIISSWLTISLLITACGDESQTPKNEPIELIDLCPSGYNCTVDNQGNAVCDEGYEREEPNNPDNTKCIKSTPQGPEQGTLGGACYGNGTCNAMLSCDGGTCVEIKPTKLETTCIAAIVPMFSDRVYLFARIKNEGSAGQFQIRLTQRGCGPADPERKLADAGPYTAPAQSDQLYETDFPIGCRGFFNAVLEIQTSDGWAEVERFEDIHKNEECK